MLAPIGRIRQLNTERACSLSERSRLISASSLRGAALVSRMSSPSPQPFSPQPY